MAIVIPVAVEGLRLASQVGQVTHRKAIALRLAENILNELIVSGQWQKTPQQGTIEEGPLEFFWRVRAETWIDGVLQLVSVQVLFTVQGQEYDVQLSTLADNSIPVETATSTSSSTSTSGQTR
ncbi:MAG: type II secretion system protein [Verrucomicrobia bacterium]|nr:type II secretion system protein [Verrucomicrobiota bacterium]